MTDPKLTDPYPHPPEPPRVYDDDLMVAEPVFLIDLS